MDVMQVVIPDTHVWAVFVAWIACYIGGHVLVGGVR